MEYFIDKRIMVTGKKSIIHMHNPFNLTEYIFNQLSLFGVTCADNGINIQTSLHPTTGLQQNCVELGGTLLHTTSILGGSYDLNITGIGVLSLSATTLNLTASTELKVVTPNITGLTASVNDILTLTNATTGACEWQVGSAPLVDNIYIANGTLTTNRTLSGAGLGLRFENLSSFVVNSTPIYEIQAGTRSTTESPDISLDATTSLRLITPSLTALTASVGQILTLTSITPGATEGTCEWQDVSNIYNTNDTLTGNRDLLGGGSSLRFSGLSSFTISTTPSIVIQASTTLDLIGPTVKVDATTALELKTPSIYTPPGGLAIGNVFTLKNITTGEGDWEAIPTPLPGTRFTQDILVANWDVTGYPGNEGEYIITAAVHGLGVDPIILQTAKDESSMVTPFLPRTLLSVGGNFGGAILLEAISIASNGDITIVVLDTTITDLRVTITN